jgi:2-keto-4-pentenoate hydratase/2-oxohepta-3-ene-1,7-dioic acid hydratase in catechol pathway
MEIVRFESDGKTSFGSRDGDAIRLIQGDILGDWRVTEERTDATGVRLLSPVIPRQIICIGLNYYGHAKEYGFGIPSAPVVFLKGNNSIAGPGDDIVLPEMAPDFVDYEGELVIVIGKRAKCIEEKDADDYILGYTCGNDVSARDCQLKIDSQWARGKSFDTFAPLGPAIVTGISPDSLGIAVKVNDEIVQSGNTSDMIFPCRKLVGYLSRCMTLLPGSVIMTGTPGGAGHFRKPPRYLKRTDSVTVEIDKLGTLKNNVT